MLADRDLNSEIDLKSRLTTALGTRMAIRLGILGAARIVPNAIAWPARVVKNCKLHAISSRRRHAAEHYAREYGIPHVLDDFNEIIESDKIDLVYVALPVSEHFVWANAALEHGKHVLCEKPLAMNLLEVQKLLATSQATGLNLFEAFHNRYHPLYRKFIDIVQTGTLGQFQEISLSFSAPVKQTATEIRYSPELGGGAMMDLGSYLVRMLFDIQTSPVKTLTAKSVFSDTLVDTETSAELLHEDGSVTCLCCSIAENNEFYSDATITAENGTLSFHNPVTPHVSGNICLAGNVRETIGKVDVFSGGSISSYTYQLDAVVDVITGHSPKLSFMEINSTVQDLSDKIYGCAGLSSSQKLAYLTHGERSFEIDL